MYNNKEMWDMIRLSNRGNFSLRKLALLFVAALTSALFMALAHTSTSYADGATWSGDNISYGGKTYTKMTDAPILPGISSDNNQIYQSTDGDTVSIIAFKETDKTKDITDAQTAIFTKDSSGNYTLKPGTDPPVTNISIAASTDAGANGGNKTANSCAVDGVGWIVCSTSKFLAGAMDKAYGWVADFLTIKPLTTDTTSGLYQTWTIAKGIANVCFIVAFLIIIYSQITNYGINNYEIKKMIPKLIVAAILVNVSYYVCGIGVDISNILGDSISKAMTEIRQSLPAPMPGIEWNTLVAAILSGGTIAALPYAIGAAGGLAALVPLLVPVLIGGILSILVAVMVLAARQALVIILIVLAPLAFVAYLLPNTEKLFEKWRSIFMNMLVIFPLFSLLFGGSQLASSIIIQSTDKASVVLFAMFVQVAPLMITPFLMKVSHNLLTQVGGFLNNPRKSLVDRSRGWASEQSQMARERYRAQGSTRSGFGKLRPQAVSYNLAKGKANRQGAIKVYQDQIAAAIAHDARAQQLQADGKAAALKKDAGEALGERLFEERKEAHTAAGQNLRYYSGMKRLAHDQVKAMETKEDAAWEAAKSNKMPINNEFAAFSTDAKAALRSQKIAEGQSMFAQSEQSDEWAKLVLSNESLQAQVGGIGGKDRALARATSEFRKNYGERIGEGKAVVDHFNLSGAERQAHALGQTITVRDSMGNIKTFTPDSNYTRESVIDTQIRQGTAEEVEGIIKVSGTDLVHYTTTISQAVAEAGIGKKLLYAGGQTIDNIAQGNITGDVSLDEMTRATILKGKIGAADLAGSEPLGLQRLYNVGRAAPPPTMSPAQAAAYTAEVNAMKQAAYTALTNPSLRGTIKANARVELNRMIKGLGGTVYDADGNLVTIDPSRNY